MTFDGPARTRTAALAAAVLLCAAASPAHPRPKPLPLPTRPMPRLPPVMAATRPSSSPMMVPLPRSEDTTAKTALGFK